MLNHFRHNGMNTLQWRHNERDGVSNHQSHDCLRNRLFRRRSKNTSKLRDTGLCEGNSPVTGEFPAQRASNREIFPFDYVIMIKASQISEVFVQSLVQANSNEHIAPHRRAVDSPHKGPVTWKPFPWHDVIIWKHSTAHEINKRFCFVL